MDNVNAFDQEKDYTTGKPLEVKDVNECTSPSNTCCGRCCSC